MAPDLEMFYRVDDFTDPWQQKVPHSELVVLPGDSFHVAATDPDRCAAALLDFLVRHDAKA